MAIVHTSFPNELYALLLQDFPENLVMTLFVFSMLNLRLWDKRVIAISSLQSVTNLIRLLPIANGLHSIILLISLVIYTQFFTNKSLSKIFAVVLILFIIAGGLELTYSGALLKLTGLSYETAFANPFLRAGFALPYEIILLLLSLGKNYYNNRKGLLTH
ncbi:MAG: hypothetical protein AB1500_09785 [Bacillota bacterium]